MGEQGLNHRVILAGIKVCEISSYIIIVLFLIAYFRTVANVLTCTCGASHQTD